MKDTDFFHKYGWTEVNAYKIQCKYQNSIWDWCSFFLKKAKTSIYFTGKRKSKKDYIYSFESYSEVVVVFLNKKLFSL